jgi:hypothetical protein
MKKFAMALFCTMALVSFVTADEFLGLVSKVDSKAGTITFTKGFGKFKKDDAPPPEAVTAKVAKGAKIAKGEFNFEDKSVKAGDALEKGLENEAFSNEKGAFAQITVADADKGDVKKGQVTSILVMQGFGKGFKKKDK